MATLSCNTRNNSKHLLATPRKMQWLKSAEGLPYPAHNFICNSTYQMRYSINVLEDNLAQEGTPFFLQLVQEDDSAIGSWKLFANSIEVAWGNIDFVNQCFEQSATAFMEACRNAIEEANISPLSKEQFEHLVLVRNIINIELNGDPKYI